MSGKFAVSGFEVIVDSPLTEDVIKTPEKIADWMAEWKDTIVLVAYSLLVIVLQAKQTYEQLMGQ